MKVLFESIGTIGTLIMCVSALPQILKTYKTKQCSDISILWLGALMTGMLLLQVYCIYLRDFVFLFGNTLSIVSTGVLIVFWFKYGRKP